VQKRIGAATDLDRTCEVADAAVIPTTHVTVVLKDDDQTRTTAYVPR
jgi:hypothetical protein